MIAGAWCIGALSCGLFKDSNGFIEARLVMQGLAKAMQRGGIIGALAQYRSEKAFRRRWVIGPKRSKPRGKRRGAAQRGSVSGQNRAMGHGGLTLPIVACAASEALLPFLHPERP